MSDFSNYNFAPNDPCIIEGRLVQLWRPRVFVELHYITLFIYLSSPNRTPKGNGYGCAEMQMSIAMDEQRSRCIFLVCWGSTNNNY